MDFRKIYPSTRVSLWSNNLSVPYRIGLDYVATSGVEVYNSGQRSSGMYSIATSTGAKSVFLDLQTQDLVTGKAGWMLAGSWSTASSWSQQATTSLSVFDSSPNNCFSANFGLMNINFMRIHVSSSIYQSGSYATSADWYFYWQTARAWRTCWVTDSSNNITWSNAVNNGVSTPREALSQFSHAYNLKFNYQVGQTWNNLSDGGASPIIGRQGDWWNGLNGTASEIGWYGAQDGSLAILPQSSSATGAGQDCNENQSKVGFDDSVLATWFGTSATANMNANNGTQGSNTSMWIWIK